MVMYGHSRMGDEAPVQPDAGGDAGAPVVVSGRAARVAAAREAMKAMPPPEPEAPVAVDAEAPKADPVEETPPEAQKGVDAIERRDKRAREQLAADRAAMEAEYKRKEADLERRLAEAAKPTPFDDLKKLPTVKRALEAMKAAGVNVDDEEVAEVIARDVYARSKSGKADPKARAYADQLAEKNGISAEVAELRRMLEETRETVAQKEQRQAMEAFQNKWLDGFTKEPPVSDSFLGLALTKNPEKARGALLSIGQRLERELGETPTHAEVIAAYEAETRADLADRGFTDEQIAGMLAKPKPPAPVKTPPRTLDPSTGPTTTPVSATTSREQKIAAARVGIKKLSAAIT